MVDEESILRIFEHYFENSEDIIQRGRYRFLKQNGSLNILGNVIRRWGLSMPDGMWPVNFGTIHGDVDMSNCGLTSLEGSPEVVHGSMNIDDNPLTNLVGLTQQISGQLNISGIDFKSLEGLPPDQSVVVTWYPNMPMLRLLTCKWIELEWFQMRDPADSHPKQVLSILRKYRRFGKKGMFDCQKELEDAGFEGNARW